MKPAAGPRAGGTAIGADAAALDAGAAELAAEPAAGNPATEFADDDDDGPPAWDTKNPKPASSRQTTNGTPTNRPSGLRPSRRPLRPLASRRRERARAGTGLSTRTPTAASHWAVPSACAVSPLSVSPFAGAMPARA